MNTNRDLLSNLNLLLCLWGGALISTFIVTIVVKDDACIEVENDTRRIENDGVRIKLETDQVVIAR